MNIVTNAGFRAWPAQLSSRQFDSASASSQAEPDSNSQFPADSRAQQTGDQPAQAAGLSSNSPETQAFLMRVQEQATPSDANAGVGAEDAPTFLDGTSAKLMRVSVSGTTAVVSFSDGSRPLTLNLALGSVTLSFDDGTTAQVMAQTPARRLQAVYEAQEEAARNFTQVA